MSASTPFGALATKINEPNPRIATGLSPAAWERQRRARRRAEYETRLASRSAIPTRQAQATGNPIAELFRAQNRSDDRSPINIPYVAQRAERGESAFQYYERKWRRFGTLGQHEVLNPYLDDLRSGRLAR